MRHKRFLVLLAIVSIVFLIASVLVNYFTIGALSPEKVVASIFSLP